MQMLFQSKYLKYFKEQMILFTLASKTGTNIYF